ncbi:hypothetical protein DTO282F9_7453 [Paecilomyces variotii]|nr:hypothetical protein DTO282F9_7453 [Paecilomyces variotii]
MLLELEVSFERSSLALQEKKDYTATNFYVGDPTPRTAGSDRLSGNCLDFHSFWKIGNTVDLISLTALTVPWTLESWTVSADGPAREQGKHEVMHSLLWNYLLGGKDGYQIMNINVITTLHP